MFVVSWELALIALVTVPASAVAMRKIAKRAQPQFINQWKFTGKLNGHIEEMYTGHALVAAFGQREKALQTFTEQNEALFNASYRAQFISGTIQPVMMFVSNLNYVLVAVVGGLLIAGGSITLGAVTAFIQYSRQFSQPLTQVASMANLLQSSVCSRCWTRRSRKQMPLSPPGPRVCAARSSSTTCRSGTRRTGR